GHSRDGDRDIRGKWISSEGRKKKRAAPGGHGAFRGQQKKGAGPHRSGSAVAAMAASAYRDDGVKAWECKVRSRDPGKCWPRGRVLKAKPRGRVLRAKPRNPGQSNPTVSCGPASPCTRRGCGGGAGSR